VTRETHSEAGAWEAPAVGVAFVVCFAAALGYTARFASWVPWWDYWDLADTIGGLRAFDLAWLFEPHQEHRIPLSKFWLVTLAWSIPDVRAASLLNVVGCGALAAATLQAARRLRGHMRLPDAVIPLLALHAGHYTTYLLGFQLQQVLSSLLVLSMLTLLLDATRIRVAVAAALLGVLPLAGVNGVVAAPPLALWVVWHLASSERRSAVGVVLGSVGVVISVAGAIDLLRLAASPPEAVPVARTALQFVAMSLGVPAARSAALVVLALAAVLASCAPALWRQLGAAATGRNEVFGLVAVLSGGVALALVIGAGRADHGAGAGIQHRYAVMSLLIAYPVYLATLVAGRTSARARMLQWGCFVAAGIAIAVASVDGIRNARHFERTLAEAERKIPVLPDDILGVELQSLLHGGSASVLARRIAALRSVGVLPELHLPPPEQLARYRTGLILRLIDAGRKVDAERQIERLAAAGAVHEAEQLRSRMQGVDPLTDEN
jgi:hypothetical protein